MKKISVLMLSTVVLLSLSVSMKVEAREITVKDAGQIELKKASFTANAKSETFSDKSMDALFSDSTEFKEDIGANINIVSVKKGVKKLDKLNNDQPDIISLISNKEVLDDKYLEDKVKKETEEKERLVKEAKEKERLETEARENKEKADAEAKKAEEAKVAEEKAAEENKTPVQGSGFAAPLTHLNLTSGFGLREDPTGNSGNGHDGIDLAGDLNENVMLSRSGTVVSAGFDGSAGNHVIVQHDNGYFTYYLHLNSISVSVGQSINTGDTVGLMGTTGNSTGVHLHFAIATTGSWSGFIDPGTMIGMY